MSRSSAGRGEFLSTLSLRRATPRQYGGHSDHMYFYPRSPCGERLSSRKLPSSWRHFYPRSPCGERQQTKALKVSALRISIHALLAESDVGAILKLQCILGDFYPRSPCGERRNGHPDTRRPYVISIHALLAESDIISMVLLLLWTPFLSTLSLRRATAISNQR